MNLIPKHLAPGVRLRCPYHEEETWAVQAFKRATLGTTVWYTACAVCSSEGPQAPTEEKAIKHYVEGRRTFDPVPDLKVQPSVTLPDGRVLRVGEPVEIAFSGRPEPDWERKVIHSLGEEAFAWTTTKTEAIGGTATQTSGRITYDSPHWRLPDAEAK